MGDCNPVDYTGLPFGPPSRIRTRKYHSTVIFLLPGRLFPESGAEGLLLGPLTFGLRSPTVTKSHLHLI